MELIAVRLPKELKERLQLIAESEHRPLSNLIRLILTKWIEEYKEKAK